MRIAFITPRFPVLSQTFVLNQITGLIDRGHTVDIFAGRPKMTDKTHRKVVQYDLLERAYHWPKNKQQALRALGYALTHSSTGRKKLISSFLHALGPVSPAESWPKRRVLAKRMLVPHARDPYDAIVAHFGPAARTAQMLRDVGALHGKLIAVFHAHDLTSYVDEHGPAVYQRVFDTAERILSISEFWCSRLLELGCSSERISVHRMGIDCTQFGFRERTSGDVTRLVTIARFVEKKGIPYALRAVARLVESHPSVEYHLVGDGPLRPEIEEIIAQLDIASHVVLHGWKEQHEIADLLNDMHILLAPSITAANGDKEGIPVAIMEAMAQGLPVVSTYHSGIPELVEDGRSGILVEEKNVNELSSALQWLLENPKEWPHLGREGRKKVVRDFNIDRLNDRFETLLANVASSQGTVDRASAAES